MDGDTTQLSPSSGHSVLLGCCKRPTRHGQILESKLTRAGLPRAVTLYWQHIDALNNVVHSNIGGLI